MAEQEKTKRSVSLGKRCSKKAIKDTICGVTKQDGRILCKRRLCENTKNSNTETTKAIVKAQKRRKGMEALELRRLPVYFCATHVIKAD